MSRNDNIASSNIGIDRNELYLFVFLNNFSFLLIEFEDFSDKILDFSEKSFRNL